MIIIKIWCYYYRQSQKNFHSPLFESMKNPKYNPQRKRSEKHYNSFFIDNGMKSWLTLTKIQYLMLCSNLWCELGVWAFHLNGVKKIPIYQIWNVIRANRSVVLFGQQISQLLLRDGRISWFISTYRISFCVKIFLFACFSIKWFVAGLMNCNETSPL